MRINKLKIYHLIWFSYWILLLVINLLYFKQDNYPVSLLILWTVLFTVSGMFISSGINKLIINFKLNQESYYFIFILALSFIGAYIWGLLEPTISWLINPNIKKLIISWNINSMQTFSLTFILAFFSLLHYIRIKKTLTLFQSKDPENENKTISFHYKNQLIVLNFNEIKLLTIEGNYTQLTNINNQSYLIRKSLKSWETELPKPDFIKVHRSCIINKNHIEKIFVAINYQLQIQLKGLDEVIKVSKRLSPILKKELASFRS